MIPEIEKTKRQIRLALMRAKAAYERTIAAADRCKAADNAVEACTMAMECNAAAMCCASAAITAETLNPPGYDARMTHYLGNGRTAQYNARDYANAAALQAEHNRAGKVARWPDAAPSEPWSMTHG